MIMNFSSIIRKTFKNDQEEYLNLCIKSFPTIFGDEDKRKLFLTISKSKPICYLQVVINTLSKKAAQYFLEIFKSHGSKLQTIAIICDPPIDNKEVDLDILYTFVDTFSILQDLKCVKFIFDEFDKTTFLGVARVLNITKITHLALCSAHFESTLPNEFLDAMKSSTTLREIELVYVKGDVFPLFNAIKNNSSINAISFSRYEDTKDILEGIEIKGFLNYKNITSVGLSRFCSTSILDDLKTSTNVKCLKLKKTKDKGLANKLNLILMQNFVLEELHIYFLCEWKVDKEFINAFAMNKSIKKFYLRSDNFPRETIDALFSALNRNNVVSLELPYVQMDRFDCLIKGMEKNRSITDLNFEYTKTPKDPLLLREHMSKLEFLLNSNRIWDRNSILNRHRFIKSVLICLFCCFKEFERKTKIRIPKVLINLIMTNIDFRFFYKLIFGTKTKTLFDFGFNLKL